ncbi:hypothetical protein F5887DRAFT_1071961 [Amanita rubescens]|nr:hypothetical protein F5887DRAFT_1071961 [Amanita rubescens]
MKVYTEKATQTDLSAVRSRPSDVLEQDISTGGNAGDILARQNSAYIDSEKHLSDASSGRDPSTRSISARKRYAELPFNRPVDFRSSAKRTVSLPEEYTDNMNPEESQRVVSMPERSKPSSPGASDSFSSLDTSTLSMESTTHSFSKPSMLHSHPRPHSDLPCTPSPPSSPESIMIIGNNSHVPRTLLRPKCAYNQEYNENSGWISWANSPPRPIPALHGPLSLPYARCPSGAEGTIIEGEDLSNMIWGLNIEDNQPRSHGQVGSHPKNQTIPPRLQTSPKLSGPILPNHGPIDLSQLTVTREHARESIQGKQSSIAIQRKGLAYDRILHTKAGHSKVHEPGIQDWNRGLGLNWQDTIELRPPKHKFSRQDSEQSTLKPSAAPFIPSGSPSPHLLPRIVVEPRFSDFVQNTRWPTVLDQTRSAESYLSTPPDPSSPYWSPYIYTPPPLDTVSPQIAYEPPNDKQILSSFGTKNCIQDINNWITEKLRPGERRAVKPDCNSPVTMASPSAGLASRDDFSESRNLAVSLTPELPAPTVNKILLQNNGQGITTSPERRFRGISQQPRSIPLARLIQRRLSSVAEEDVNALMDDATIPPVCSSRTAVRAVSDPWNSDQTKAAHQAIREAPSPDSKDFNPQTCKSPNHEAMTDVVTETGLNHKLKAIVKLPGNNVGSAKLTANHEEKENSAFHGQRLIEPAGTTVKKMRNRKRSRSSSSIRPSK